MERKIRENVREVTRGREFQDKVCLFLMKAESTACMHISL